MTSQIESSAPQLKTTLVGDEPQTKARQAWYWQTICRAFLKLNPSQQIRNPVMFLVELGALVTTMLFIRTLLGGSSEPPAFSGVVAAWLWLTVLSVNFAETRSEASGRFRAEAMRQRCRNITAKKLNGVVCRENYDYIPAASLGKDDLILIETGETIPADGEIVNGAALVDESLLFGKQPPMFREVRDAGTAIAGGTRVLFNWLVIRLTANPAESLLSNLVNLLQAAKCREFPHMTFLKMLFAGSILIVLLFVNTVWFSSFAWFSTNVTIMVALLLSLMPIPSQEMWRLVNLAEVDQLIRVNVIPVSNWAVEAAEKVDVLLLNKCAVVDLNHSQAVTANSLVDAKVDPATWRPPLGSPIDEIPATQSTVTLPEKRNASDEDIRVDQGLKGRLAQLRRIGVKTVLTTTDSPHAAAALAAEAGVDDFLARVTPAARLELIRDYQARGFRVAVAGSRAGEAITMRQADLAVAMNASAHPARETAGMIDLTGNPVQLVKIAEIARQRLAIRRSVTLLTLASDTAKYFVLIPAVFASIFPVIQRFNFINLTTPAAAILAAIIFNAMSIVILARLAGRGTPGRAWDTVSSSVYVLIGLLSPFVGIKVIDLILTYLGFT